MGRKKERERGTFWCKCQGEKQIPSCQLQEEVCCPPWSPSSFCLTQTGPVRNGSASFTWQLMIKPACSSLGSQWSHTHGCPGNGTCWKAFWTVPKWKQSTDPWAPTLRASKEGGWGLSTCQRKLSNFLFNYWDKRVSLVSFSCSNRNLFKYLNRKSLDLPSCPPVTAMAFPLR